MKRTGTAEADELWGSWDSDLLIGKGGDDTLWGEAGDDTLAGGGGNDVLHAGVSTDADILRGGGGDDLALAAMDDVADGGAGEDLLFLTASGARRIVLDLSVMDEGGVARTRAGGAFSAFEGGSVSTGGGNDVLRATDGGWSLDGNGGDDRLYGARGSDTLSGGEGHDLIKSGGGDDVIWVGGGFVEESDSVAAGEGDDLIHAGAGDTVDGGSGADWIELDLSDTGRAVRLDFGKLTAGSAVLPEATTLALVESGDIASGSGDDRLSGHEASVRFRAGDGADSLTGSSSGDFLEGGAGADVIVGGRGDDTLSDGGGDDLLQGGEGADWFLFSEISAADRVLDFNSGDTVDLRDIDARTDAYGNQAFQLVSSFSGVAGEAHIRFDGVATVLEFDVDGDGAADGGIFFNGDHRTDLADALLL